MKLLYGGFIDWVLEDGAQREVDDGLQSLAVENEYFGGSDPMDGKKCFGAAERGVMNKVLGVVTVQEVVKFWMGWSGTSTAGEVPISSMSQDGDASCLDNSMIGAGVHTQSFVHRGPSVAH